MKTPMQEVYAHLKASKEKDGFGEVYCVDWLLENESKILNKERQVIENAFLDGYTHSPDDGFPEYARNYYNETFNTKEI